jgi:hypothetical protein
LASFSLSCFKVEGDFISIEIVLAVCCYFCHKWYGLESLSVCSISGN